MPSKQETEPASEQKKEFLHSEVEELVAAINRKLQLKSRPCLGGVCTKQKRVSPYTVPLRTISRKSDKENSPDSSFRYCCRLKTKSPASDSTPDDPYEMLQDLLREGGLIKEAVKRIQLGLHRAKPTETNYYDLDDLDVKSPRFYEL